jgi:hypothetical protein
MVFFLVRVEVSEISFGLWTGSELGQNAENLSAGDCADIDVVSKYCDIGRGHWEWYLRESWIKRLDSNDSIPFLRKTEGAKKALDFYIWIGRPNANVITMLVSDAGSSYVKFHVNTIPVLDVLEQFARQGNWGGIWVLRIMDALGSGESTSRQFTAVNLLRREGILNFVHGEVGSVPALSLLYVHYASKCFPHAVLPFEIIFFHALVIIALTALTNPRGAHFGKMFVDLFCNDIVMFVSLVSEAKYDVFETVKSMFALAKFKGLVRKILHQLDSVVGRFTFSVRCHNENCSTILWDFIQILEVIFFGVTNKGSEAKLGFGLLGDTNSVFFGCPSL